MQGEGRGFGIMYEGGTIRDECREREEGMVLCTRGALSGMSAGRGKGVWYYVRGGHYQG